MKLRMKEVEAKLTAAWGNQAFVVPYRISGNRTVYAATDHGDHYLPLKTSWNGGGQVFEPVGADWPWVKRDPWPDAVLDAAQLALAHFVDQGDKAAVKRLPRAQVIAESRNWHRIGDKFDTWLMPSQSKMGLVYMVNGRCNCPDRVTWCKHRQVRALAMRAGKLTQEQIQSLQDFAATIAEGLEAADENFKSRRRIIKMLHTTATLLVEDGKQIIDARCLLGAEILQVEHTSSHTSPGDSRCTARCAAARR